MHGSGDLLPNIGCSDLRWSQLRSPIRGIQVAPNPRRSTPGEPNVNPNRNPDIGECPDIPIPRNILGILEEGDGWVELSSAR